MYVDQVKMATRRRLSRGWKSLGSSVVGCNQFHEHLDYVQYQRRQEKAGEFPGRSAQKGLFCGCGGHLARGD